MSNTEEKKSVWERIQDSLLASTALMTGLSIAACLALWYFMNWKVVILVLVGAASFALVRTLRISSIGPEWLLNALYYVMVIAGPAIIALAAIVLYP